ncbi:MAG: isoaspartyl peptidase/L-asparaginase, partial [Gammaproteobacteria bacterium]|nr:isoaspartyl peptidase/L-asparaginase [Gammaproteobacteria bacterium]
ITLARAVMDKSRHVMFAGQGAEQFAKEQNIEFVEPDYFRVERRWQQYLKFKEKSKSQAAIYEQNPAYKMGTVGAVAIDTNGTIAAGTSTGGMTGKMYGRVGDVPIIGAGTYANNASCGVSATGHGEFFIRATVARSICALMEYGGLGLQQAAEQIVMKQLVEMQGDGGIIAVDKDANMALVFNSKGMYRGSIASDKPLNVAIYSNEDEK